MTNQLIFRIGAFLSLGQFKRVVFNITVPLDFAQQGQVIQSLAPATVLNFSSVDNIYVNTEQPLTFTGVNGATTVTFQINKQLLLDQHFDSWSITNGSLQNEVKLVWTANQ